MLAEVYLAMTRGQDSLTIDEMADDGLLANLGPIDAGQLIVLAAAPEEIAAHEAVLDGIEKEAKAVPVWRTAAACYARLIFSRSSRFSTLPVAFLGNSSTNT